MTKTLEKPEKNETLETEACEETKEDPTNDPTRFGDWQKNGRCIDF